MLTTLIWSATTSIACYSRLGRLGAEREEAGSHEMPIALASSGGQQVAGDLLGKKTIVRRVTIESLNHIIPITPRMRERGIAARPSLPLDSP